ncbi:MAG: hypothetical protein H0V27_05030 [Pyrinomonadaceae bacterium]|nr:hypothetical protein [Pyrinomonadaceae bacterium]
MKRETRATSENESPEGEETDRITEQGEADEPDAPTSGDENEGMSTILDASPTVGVQEDAGDE